MDTDIVLNIRKYVKLTAVPKAPNPKDCVFATVEASVAKPPTVPSPYNAMDFVPLMAPKHALAAFKVATEAFERGVCAACITE